MTSSETTVVDRIAQGDAELPRRRKPRWQPLLRSVIFNSVLLLGAFLSAFPFYWMFVLVDPKHATDLQLAAQLPARR